MSYRPTPDLHDTDTAIKQELLLNTTIIVTSQKSQFAQINVWVWNVCAFHSLLFDGELHLVLTYGFQVFTFASSRFWDKQRKDNLEAHLSH